MLVVAATVVGLLLAATLLVFALKVGHHMKKATSSTPRVDAIVERQKWITFASRLLRLCVEIHGASDVQVTEKEFDVVKLYATRLVRLAFLAPDIVAAILAGKQPPGLTANKLMADTRLPLDWRDQRAALGFA